MLGNYNILPTINMAVFVFFFFMTMNKRGYNYKFKNKTQFILSLTLLIALFIIKMPFGIVIVPILIATILIVLLICKITYQMDIKKSIINSIIYTFIYILISGSIYWILQILFIDENIRNYILENILELTTILNFIVVFVLIYFFDKIKSMYKTSKYYIYIILTIVINLVTVLFFNIASEKISDLWMIVIKNNIKYSNLQDLMMFSLFMKHTFPYMLLIINIILISIFINSIKSEKEKVKIQFVNEKLDMQHKYYLMAKESQEKMKKVYHDMNNHMKNIKMLKNNNEDVNTYINSIEDEVKNTKNIYNTGNMLLDIILYEKGKVCIDNNIDFKVAIDFSKCDFIEMIDISSIFSNLIDNAIEACNKINNNEIERYITIKSTFIKGYYVIRCENSKVNKIILKNNKIFTTKKDGFFHGIGIESINSSIKKYDGELKIKDDNYKFIASIYIPIE